MITLNLQVAGGAAGGLVLLGFIVYSDWGVRCKTFLGVVCGYRGLGDWGRGVSECSQCHTP